MKKLINWLNKPLPKGACWAFGHPDGNCKVCWTCVILIFGTIALVLLLT